MKLRLIISARTAERKPSMTFKPPHRRHSSLCRIGVGPVGVYVSYRPGRPIHVCPDPAQHQNPSPTPPITSAVLDPEPQGRGRLHQAPAGSPAMPRSTLPDAHSLEWLKVETPAPRPKTSPDQELRNYESHSKKANRKKIESSTQARSGGVAPFLRRAGLSPVFLATQ